MTGFWALLRGELNRWIGRRGLLHLIGWTLLIQGQLYLSLTTGWDSYNAFWGFDLVVNLLWLFPPLGAIAVAQSAIAEERAWDTVGWVLARPVTRAAFVTSKIVGTALPLILLAVVTQGVIAYVWLPDVEPERGFAAVEPALGRYAAVLGVLSLLVLLFVALSVALGTVFRRRAMVATISLIVFLLFTFPPGERSATWHEWFPGGLVEGQNDGADYKRISEYLLGGSFDGAGAVAVAAIAVLALTAFGAWRFGHEEL
mgnify:FL=1